MTHDKNNMNKDNERNTSGMDDQKQREGSRQQDSGRDQNSSGRTESMDEESREGGQY